MTGPRRWLVSWSLTDRECGGIEDPRSGAGAVMLTPGRRRAGRGLFPVTRCRPVG